jgi:hypothetical protein
VPKVVVFVTVNLPYLNLSFATTLWADHHNKKWELNNIIIGLTHPPQMPNGG